MSPYFLGWLILVGVVFVGAFLTIAFTRKIEEVIVALLIFIVIALFGLIGSFEFAGVGGTTVTITEEAHHR